MKLSCCTSATNDAVGDGNCNGEAEMADRDKITGTHFQCLLEQINKIGVNAELKIHSKNFPPAALPTTGSSKINGAKFSDACSVRANWLCMGWPFFLAEMRREFQTGGKFFLHHAVEIIQEEGLSLGWSAILPEQSVVTAWCKKKFPLFEIPASFLPSKLASPCTANWP